MLSYFAKLLYWHPHYEVRGITEREHVLLSQLQDSFPVPKLTRKYYTPYN